MAAADLPGRRAQAVEQGGQVGFDQVGPGGQGGDAPDTASAPDAAQAPGAAQAGDGGEVEDVLVRFPGGAGRKVVGAAGQKVRG